MQRHEPWGLDQVTRIEEHADRDEEQHGEGVAHRQGLGRGTQAELRTPDDHPGEEGTQAPSRRRRALADPTAMPSASTSTVSVNSSRERVAAARASSQGISRSPPIEHQHRPSRRPSRPPAHDDQRMAAIPPAAALSRPKTAGSTNEHEAR